MAKQQEYKLFYIGNISLEKWKQIFEYCLNKADYFKLQFNENVGNWFLKEIKSLKLINEIDRIKEKIVLSGELSDDIKEKILMLQQPLYDGGCTIFWDFQLYVEDRIILYIENIVDIVVKLNPLEIEELRKLDINIEECAKTML